MKTPVPPRLLLGLGLALAAASPALAQAESFKEIIARGDYPALGERLAEHLDLDRADPELRRYLELNLEYLAAGAPRAAPEDEIVVVRGVANDTLYEMPASAGGELLLLPPGIRFSDAPWTERLDQIERYFTSATSGQGGDGASRHELERIIRSHATTSNGSVLVSASTYPQAVWGPKFVVIRIPPERTIFNYTSPYTNEREVLIPFFVLPTEVVAVCESVEEALAHPAVAGSRFRDLSFRYSRWCPTVAENRVNPVWELIEANVRARAPPLEDVAAGPPACPGDDASATGLSGALSSGSGLGTPAPATPVVPEEPDEVDPVAPPPPVIYGETVPVVDGPLGE